MSTEPSRYIRIDGAYSDYINLQEIRVYTLNEVEVTGLSASMDSEYNGGAYPASNCVDGDMGTFCVNEGPGGWLEIDMGSLYPIGKIEVVNRLDCCSNRIVGASISTWTEPGGTGTRVWHGSIENELQVYTFFGCVDSEVENVVCGTSCQFCQ